MTFAYFCPPVNFADCALRLESAAVVLGLIFFYAGIAYIVIQILVKKLRNRPTDTPICQYKCTSCLSCCDRFKKYLTCFIEKCTPILSYVIKFLLPENVYSATLKDGSPVVVVKGFILKPQKVLQLVIAIVYFGLAFLLIVGRNGFIEEETSRFSACYTGGLVNNRYKNCIIFYNHQNPSSKSLTAEDCNTLNCEDCPNRTVNSKYTILCLESTPDFPTAIAELIGLVTITRIILSIYSFAVFALASNVPQPKSFKQVWCYRLGILIVLHIACFAVFGVGVWVIYCKYGFHKNGSHKGEIYLLEWTMYIIGLMTVMGTLPWTTAPRYDDGIHLDEEKIDEITLDSTSEQLSLTENKKRNYRQLQ